MSRAPRPSRMSRRAERVRGLLLLLAWPFPFPFPFPLLLSSLLALSMMLFGGSLWPVFAQQASASAESSGTELRPVPVPSLDAFEPAVREQLEQAQDELDRRLEQIAVEADGESRSQLAKAFAKAGRLYLFYDRADAAEACLVNAAHLDPGTFAWHYFLGTLYQGSGRLELAMGALERARQLEPDDTPTLLRLADSKLRARQLSAAEDLYRRVLELENDNAVAHQGLGRLASENRDFEAAARHLERALALQPESNTLYHPLGLAYRRLGDLDRARAALRRAGNSAPFMEDPLMRDLYDETRSARSYAFEGNRARRRGLTELAITNYRRAVEIDPTLASAHYNLGVLLGDAGDVVGAQSHFRSAIEHDPAARDAHFNLAIGLRAGGQLEEAATHFSRAAALDPTDQAARVEWSVTRIAQGRRQEGVEALFEVWRKKPEDVALLLLLGGYVDQAGFPEVSSEVLEWAASLATTPDERSSVWLAKARQARARFDRRGVENALRQAVAVAPEIVEPRLVWADYLLESGKYPQASQEYARAAELDPESISAVLGQASASFAMGRFADARQMLETARGRFPTRPAVATTLVQLLASCPDPGVADPADALRLAVPLAQTFPSPSTLETLAMALAANGRFPEAVALQEDLLARMGSSPPGVPDAAKLRSRLQSNLSRYRSERAALFPFTGGR